MFGIFNSRQPRPEELADQAQRILIRTLKFGLPEEWVKVDEGDKNKLREIIAEMRHHRSDAS
jgi:hypothetical protein